MTLQVLKPILLSRIVFTFISVYFCLLCCRWWHNDLANSQFRESLASFAVIPFIYTNIYIWNTMWFWDLWKASLMGQGTAAVEWFLRRHTTRRDKRTLLAVTRHIQLIKYIHLSGVELMVKQKEQDQATGQRGRRRDTSKVPSSTAPHMGAQKHISIRAIISWWKLFPGC